MPDVSFLAVPAVLTLIGFLACSSQLLFYDIRPGPLEKDDAVYFNLLLTCMLIAYARSCTVDPGTIPKAWAAEMEATKRSRLRWCRKCEAPKPPRAHHCRTCARCIPRMDHHCPWTINCVSHRTYPHFMRFLLYAVLSLWTMETYLWTRGAYFWARRHSHNRHGPSPLQLSHLMALFVVNTVTLIALGVLFIRCLWILVTNTTTIESWEISRHATLVRRARTLGGYLYGPQGERIFVRHQEFPYDIGLWRNIADGMGTANPLLWFFPLSPTPPLERGLSFDENGFENEDAVWPPPDPDRLPRPPRATDAANAFVYDGTAMSPAEQLDAFKARQEEDLWRRGLMAGSEDHGVLRRRTFAKRYERFVHEGSDSDDDGSHERDRAELSDDRSDGTNGEGEEAWRNEEGERLNDFGVDEDAEFYDGGKSGFDAEDDIPLSKLMEMKRARLKSR